MVLLNMEQKEKGILPSFVFIKSMTDFTGDMLLDYPFIHTKDTQKFILAVKPEFHTPLFPDSILNTEERNKEFHCYGCCTYK